MAGIRRLAVLLTAGAIAAGGSATAAGATPASPTPAQQLGWVITPSARPAPSRSAVRLAHDLGIAPDKAQEIIDAAYR